MQIVNTEPRLILTTEELIRLLRPGLAAQNLEVEMLMSANLVNEQQVGQAEPHLAGTLTFTLKVLP